MVLVLEECCKELLQYSKIYVCKCIQCANVHGLLTKTLKEESSNTFFIMLQIQMSGLIRGCSRNPHFSERTCSQLAAVTVMVTT